MSNNGFIITHYGPDQLGDEMQEEACGRETPAVATQSSHLP